MIKARKKNFDRLLQWRKRILCALIVFCFVAILVRVINLQILDADSLAELARNEYCGTIEILPQRGDIVDRLGRKLAASVKTPSLYAQPRKIENKQKVAAQLARELDLNQNSVWKKLDSKKSFVWIERKINPTEKEALEKLNIQGIGFLPETKRIYPRRFLASHVLGFVGMDGKGLGGLELSYESMLKGRKRTDHIVRDARKRIIAHNEIERDDESLEGSTLVLTLDEYIQHVVEEELRTVRTKYRAKSALAIVVEVGTGRVLAMAVDPGYNPNVFTEYNQSVLRNRAITDSFEPGSTMKVFTASLVLENNIAKPTDIFFCENGKYRYAGHTIHDTHKYGWLTLEKIVQVSSNIGALKMTKQLSSIDFSKGLENFGFGEKTGLDLPGETRGIMRDGKSWRSIDKAVISFGQGVSVSPLQLVMGLSAIANGGLLMRPYLVERILGPDGEVIFKNKPQLNRRAISENTAKEMSAILQLVVREGGTGSAAAIEGYNVAGKTGTAQKVIPGGRGYSRDKYVSSFMGFLPAENPKIATLVMVDEPHGQSYGGVVAAPAFKNICEKIISYMGIRPNEVFLAQKQIERAMADLEKQAETPAKTESDVEVVQAADENAMPNLIGLDLRSALSIVDDLSIPVSFEGSGFVVRQYPVPGQTVNGVEKINLWLNPEKGLES